MCWGAYFRPPEEFLVGDIRDVSILRAGRDFFIHLGSRSTQLLPWYLVHAQWRFDELLDEAPPAESFRKCCLSSLFPKVKVKVSQLYLTLCNPMDCMVHRIFQARILKWVAFSFSRGSYQPRDWTQVSCIADRFLTSWVEREALRSWAMHIPSPCQGHQFWSGQAQQLYSGVHVFQTIWPGSSPQLQP